MGMPMALPIYPVGGWGRVIPNWMFENAKGKKTMMQNNTVFNWCTNNCHTKLMWCTYNPCYNQAGFRKRMKEKIRKDDKTVKDNEKKFQPSNDFKIA
eukprot:4658484-Ditylum_brightwellii.AAC.1